MRATELGLQLVVNPHKEAMKELADQAQWDRNRCKTLLRILQQKFSDQKMARV